MIISVRHWSWFKELAGTDLESYELESGASLDSLLNLIRRRHPQFEKVRQSTLVAVGVDYQPPGYALSEGDEVSLFPPVQGG